MQSILISLDKWTLETLNEIAPPGQRKRADFVRKALRKAIMAEMEERSRAGYERIPDDEPIADDWSSWEAWEG
jgi:metal-responsive CopG/Arc/MetJ family transcriptional regulator